MMSQCTSLNASCQNVSYGDNAIQLHVDVCRMFVIANSVPVGIALPTVRAPSELLEQQWTLGHVGGA